MIFRSSQKVEVWNPANMIFPMQQFWAVCCYSPNKYIDFPIHSPHFHCIVFGSIDVARTSILLYSINIVPVFPNQKLTDLDIFCASFRIIPYIFYRMLSASSLNSDLKNQLDNKIRLQCMFNVMVSGLNLHLWHNSWTLLLGSIVTRPNGYKIVGYFTKFEKLNFPTTLVLKLETCSIVQI
jgi:hypothetical protein